MFAFFTPFVLDGRGANLHRTIWIVSDQGILYAGIGPGLNVHSLKTSCCLWRQKLDKGFVSKDDLDSKERICENLMIGVSVNCK